MIPSQDVVANAYCDDRTGSADNAILQFRDVNVTNPSPADVSPRHRFSWTHGLLFSKVHFLLIKRLAHFHLPTHKRQPRLFEDNSSSLSSTYTLLHHHQDERTLPEILGSSIRNPPPCTQALEQKFLQQAFHQLANMPASRLTSRAAPHNLGIRIV